MTTEGGGGDAAPFTTKEKNMIKLLINFPLMAVAVICYLIALSTGFLGAHFISYQVPSGSMTSLLVADILVLAALFLLAIELLKATRTGFGSMGDHALSTILLVVMSILYFVVPGFGTSTFLILTAMQFIDVACGVVITITAVRRDVGIDGIGALS